MIRRPPRSTLYTTLFRSHCAGLSLAIPHRERFPADEKSPFPGLEPHVSLDRLQNPGARRDGDRDEVRRSEHGRLTELRTHCHHAPHRRGAFYCVLALLLTSLLQRELARQGEELSVNRILEELGEIQETLIVYPRRQGQRQHTTATCLTRMSPLQSRLFSLLDLKRYASPSR